MKNEETQKAAERQLYSDESRGEDLELIEKVKKGGFDAFERIVRKYEARIYNHCVKFLNNQEDAEDVLQETFLQVYRSLDSFRGDSAFSTWLFKIATNGCLMRLRKKKKVDLVSIDKPMEFDGSMLQREIVDWTRNPANMSGKEDLRATLDRVISDLPEDKRIVFIMKDVEGFSNVEIGQILNMTVAAVKSRLHRARLILREELTRYFSGETDPSKAPKR